MDRMSDGMSTILQPISTKPAVAALAPTAPRNPLVRIPDGTPTGGTFTVTVGGLTTAGIAYNASAATVQSAIQSLGGGFPFGGSTAQTATVSGSAGVLLPPKGYLERLREICTKHGILLIYDEVITGFGRLGEPFGSQRLGVMPDLFTTAKGMTNGAVPMGAVFVREDLYDVFMKGPDGIELFHGYTYSGHPLACAAGIATLETYADEGLLTRAAKVGSTFEEAVHSLKGLPNVIDVRNIGLVGGIELAPIAGDPGKRAFDVFLDCWQKGLLVRTTGDTVALSPPLIVESQHIDQIVGTLADAIKRAA